MKLPLDIDREPVIIDSMNTTTDGKKNEVWNYFSKVKPFPNGVTEKRLERIKPIIFKWGYFWQDIMAHGLIDKTPEQLKVENKETYNHCVGNFWGMVNEAMYKSGIKK